MENNPTRIVQISDIHLYADKDKDLLGVKTHESFQALLDLLKKDKIQPKKIILSGDLSQDFSETSYRFYEQYLSSFAVPTYYVPGNHDHQGMMDKILKGGIFSTSKQFIVDNWQFILLNSQKPGEVWGILEQSQLDFLEDCLNKYANLQTNIIFHHHPISVGSAWLDPLGLTNAELFWEVVEQYPQVNTVFFGHIHQEHEGERKGIKYFSAPSTCIQFKRLSPQFALEKLSPGYRWIDLYQDGSLKTGVKRVKNYIGTFVEDATGY